MEGTLARPGTGHYDAKYFAYQAPIGVFGGWANLGKFAAYVQPDDAVLDFGCGGGYLLENLRCRARAGIEVNPVARNEASRRGLEVFSQTADVPDGWADLLISNNALEHTQHPLQELQALWPKVKPGGRVVFVVPCEAISYAYRPGDPNHHLYSWSPMCLGNLFTEAGFSVQECKPYIHKWPPHYLWWARWGRRVFDWVCRLYGRWERSWFQVRLVGRKPKD